MKTANKTLLPLLALFYVLITRCAPEPKKDSGINVNSDRTFQKPLILNIELDENKIVCIAYDSLNWEKIQLDTPSYILYNIKNVHFNKIIHIKKEFIALRTGYEFRLKRNQNKATLNINSFNYGSTHFEDSLIFTLQIIYLL